MSGMVTECTDIDRHGGYPRFFQGPGSVSHGHVTDGSGGDEEYGIDPRGLKTLGPGRRLFEKPLL